MYVWAHAMHASIHVGAGGQLWGLLFYSHHVGSWDWVQVIRLGNKLLDPLSHLPGLLFVFFFFNTFGVEFIVNPLDQPIGRQVPLLDKDNHGDISFHKLMSISPLPNKGFSCTCRKWVILGVKGKSTLCVFEKFTIGRVIHNRLLSPLLLAFCLFVFSDVPCVSLLLLLWLKSERIT